VTLGRKLMLQISRLKNKTIVVKVDLK